jgi:hypothetical protein
MLLHIFAQQFVYVYNTSLFRSLPLDKVQRDLALGKGLPRAGRQVLTDSNPWRQRVAEIHGNGEAGPRVFIYRRLSTFYSI